MKIETLGMPDILKNRYTQYSCEDLAHCRRVDELNNMNKSPIKVSDYNTDAFKIFSHEFNSIMLTSHLFENLLMFEDVRHEQAGHPWFQIEIPEEYFRYPAQNDPRNFHGTNPPKMTQHDRDEISTVVNKSKEMANFANDENFAKNNLHKLEFLSIFSFLESYVENLLVEQLGKTRQDASICVKRSSLPNILEQTLNEIDSDINVLLNKLSNNLYGYFTFCYLLRNLHTHNLGKVTNYFINKCEEANLLEEDYVTTLDGEKIIKGKCVNFTSYRKRIELDRYITLSHINYSFRNYARECVFIAEQYIIHKNKNPF
ncbi:hypothetical protein NRZ29_01615 [Aeromonas hydrophila]|uniref:hypothetical protein n=1 Tax=Aeromonas hydrophila TaxID=644 RepID=UPI00227C461F|nr:hypothetical protein [Aeromonas hydrophila]WAG15931.1 hypothetical protein NRZ29_01615 [Aeromonas hydrophila]